MIRKAAVSRSFLLTVAIGLSGCTSREPAPQATATPVAMATAALGTQAAAPATAPAAPPSGPPAIATADGETAGVRVEVTELKRTSGGTVNLKFVLINGSDERHSFSYDYADKNHEITDFSSIGGVHLIDPVGKKKYFVARDAENKCLCSQKIADIPKGGRANLWAKFPAPPDDVQQISIVIPHFSPMDDVPLSR